MTDHALLSDAIVRPAFGPDSGHGSGDGLANHLAGCAACRATLAGVRVDEAAIAGYAAGEPSSWVRRRVVSAAEARRSAVRDVSRLLVVGLLAIGAIAGGVAGAGALMGLRTVAETPPETVPQADLVAGKQVIWKTDAVILAADAVSLTSNGRALHPDQLPVKVGGDPGSLTRATLEVFWVEDGLEQRIFLYFAADDTSWWMTEAQAYDNVGPSPEWASLRGLVGRQPLGVPYRGDLDLEGPSEAHASRARVHVTDAVLLFNPQPSFVGPADGGLPLKQDPFEIDGPFRCSGILQMAPMDAERELLSRGLRISWRFDSKTGPNTGFSELRLKAPDTGWIIDTALGSDGELILFVADPAKPTGKRIPLPADCKAPPSG